MAQNFSIPRNIILSCLNYLQTNLNSSWSGVSVMRTYKEVYATTSKVPLVCGIISDTSSVYREIGDTVTEDRPLIVIDIYAASDPQREDLAYTIKQLLALGWIHYDYSRESGDTIGNLVGIANGRETVTQFVTDAKVDIGDTVDTKDRWRHRISVRVRYSPTIPTY